MGQLPTRLTSNYSRAAASSLVDFYKYSPLVYLYIVATSPTELVSKWCNFILNILCISLVPRPFPPPVFDRLQYANTEVGTAWERG